MSFKIFYEKNLSFSNFESNFLHLEKLVILQKHLSNAKKGFWQYFANSSLIQAGFKLPFSGQVGKLQRLFDNFASL